MMFRVEYDLETGERQEIPLTPQEIADLEAAAPPATNPVIVVYPVDLWSRMTDHEAEDVETAMAAQPLRIRNIFKYASSYQSDHELWPLLESMATALFGPERAAQILAPS